MAAVYAQSPGTSPGGRVAVRRGPRGRSLKIDGTFASWYKPGRVTTGSVWDALVAPMLLLPRTRRRSVLILGLGGGSAARIARAVAPRARIVGVEHDPEVVRAARRWFDLDELRVDVVEGCAHDFLRRSRRRFDMVIEDVFVGAGRKVHKPEWLPHPGLELAARRVVSGGLLVSNALDEAPLVAREMRRLFPTTLRIEVSGYDNQVFAGGPAPLSGRALRSAVGSDPVLRGSASRLSFRRIPASGDHPRGSAGRSG